MGSHTTKGIESCQSAISSSKCNINTGTTVTWFNADAAHKHQITLLDNKSGTVAYESGLFDNFDASKPFRPNNTGIFAYSGPSNDKAVPNYKMNKTLTVVNQPNSNSFNTTSSTIATSNNINTISTIIIIVPGIDNQYPFKSLRAWRRWNIWSR